MVRGHLRQRLVIRKFRRNRRRTKLPKLRPRVSRPKPLVAWAGLPTDYTIRMHRENFHLQKLYFLYKFTRMLGQHTYQYWYLLYHYMIFELFRYFFFKKLKSLSNTLQARIKQRRKKKRGVKKGKRFSRVHELWQRGSCFTNLIYRMLPLSRERFNKNLYSSFMRKRYFLKARLRRWEHWCRKLGRGFKMNERLDVVKLLKQKYDPRAYYDEMVVDDAMVIRAGVHPTKLRAAGFAYKRVWGWGRFKHFFEKRCNRVFFYRVPMLLYCRKSTRYFYRIRFGTKEGFVAARFLRNVLKRYYRFFCIQRNIIFLKKRRRSLRRKILNKSKHAALFNYLNNFKERCLSWGLKRFPFHKGFTPSTAKNLNMFFISTLDKILHREFIRRHLSLEHRHWDKEKNKLTFIKKSYKTHYTKYFKLANWRYTTNRSLYAVDNTKVKMTHKSFKLRRDAILSNVFRNYFIREYWKERQVRYPLRFFINMGQRVGGVKKRWIPKYYHIRKALRQRHFRKLNRRNKPKHWMRRMPNHFSRRLLLHKNHFLFFIVKRWASYMQKFKRLKLQLKFTLTEEPLTFSFLQTIPQTLYSRFREESFINFYDEHVNYMYMKKTGLEAYNLRLFPTLIKEWAFYDLPLDAKINKFFTDLDLQCTTTFGDPLIKIKRASLAFRSYKHFGIKFYNGVYYPIEYDCMKTEIQDLYPLFAPLWPEKIFFECVEAYTILNLLLLFKTANAV